ncbi:serine O-acetyltransferase [Solitalea sp. MAHUQ-68]|uniref:Serine O-acetyltransferase n=1 Tax=Solitalea agri TaxID=2953739 RepID=A0A9X2JCG5_9SPHI|nr:serine O-acetyltransferase [Solitalea agri]MCO4292509.1 serine O-acetyltransferase [Solitalea agri]
MDKQFLQILLDKHRSTGTYPSNTEIYRLAKKLLRLMFPEKTNKHYLCTDDLANKFAKQEELWVEMLSTMQHVLPADAKRLVKQFMDRLPYVYEVLLTDMNAIFTGDPASRSEFEVVRTYPGFLAIAYYRLAHELHKLDIPLIPRILTEHAHSKTGIDIHPGAQIDTHFFIDHGTGITIGETCEIGKHVKMYQGITLGALSVSKNLASLKRHPTIEDNVVIYSGATILGGETIIGHDSIIGGNVWLTSSIAPYSKVYHQSQNKYIEMGMDE